MHNYIMLYQKKNLVSYAIICNTEKLSFKYDMSLKQINV